ncbi:MAG: YkgJ family cysteine cluster protein [Desulfobacteraceae bacterium]|nr:YkgJ family cysteine cluster protein [Desulfobacteraceae bacterium]
MKYINVEDIDTLPGKQIKEDQTFKFRCHPEVACFNRCCRNLNLFLYPYDVLRLKNSLGISSDEFIDSHVDIVMRKGYHFPDVLLRMADNKQQTCPFLVSQGCSVYLDRPDTCRGFPVEQGIFYDAVKGSCAPVYFFRPPDFCLGQHEEKSWTIETWQHDQDAKTYHRMTALWADIRRLFHQTPWGLEGFSGAKGKMAFMAVYNVDRFRDFIFNSSFLKRYRIKPEFLKKMRAGDTALLKFGFEWIRFFIWGQPSKVLKPKK